MLIVEIVTRQAFFLEKNKIWKYVIKVYSIYAK